MLVFMRYVKGSFNRRPQITVSELRRGRNMELSIVP